MAVNPEQLFELFYKNVRDDMCPPGLCRSSYRREWWRERFMNAYNNVQESRELRSWAEAPQMWLAAYKEFSNEPKKIYEVGTYEPYEEGFHAFYRTRSKDRAEQVKAWAIECQDKIPEVPLGIDDELFAEYFSVVDKIDEDFSRLIGKDFSIRRYSKDMYSIQIFGFELDA